jgi:DNA-directed RNA polymerase specialized sigma24 family protein
LLPDARLGSRRRRCAPGSAVGAWKGLSGFEGRSSLRSWLYTIATNASLRVLEGRRRRELPGGTGTVHDPRAPLAEPMLESVWIEPYPDELLRYEDREGVELAYVAASVITYRQLAVAMRESGMRRQRHLGRVDFPAAHSTLN